MSKKLLLIVLLIVGCAINTTTLNTDEIKSECKIDCKTLAISSNEWCNCMHQCSSNKLKVLPFNNRVYVEECRGDSMKSN